LIFAVKIKGSCDALERAYMLAIIALPKPEHDSCVAPSIKRAKS
jgi:hypothetical protein